MQEAFNEYLSEVYSLKAKIELMDMKRWRKQSFTLIHEYMVFDRPWNQNQTFPNRNYKICSGWNIIDSMVE